jgi:hypothetical protein
MTADELLKIYAEPVGVDPYADHGHDGHLYDVWDLREKIAEGVDRRRAVLLARQQEDLHTGADLNTGIGLGAGWSSAGRNPIWRSH